MLKKHETRENLTETIANFDRKKSVTVIQENIHQGHQILWRKRKYPIENNLTIPTI